MQTSSIDLDLQYLAAEVRAMDARVRGLMRAWLRSGQDQSDRFRGLYISRDEAQRFAGLSPAPAPASATASAAAAASVEAGDPQDSAGDVAPPADDDLYQALTEARQESHRIVQEAQQRGLTLRLERLKNSFDLSDFEYQAFLVCLLPALDLSYERIYAFLQDDVTRKQAGVDLILSLLAPDAHPVERLGLMNTFGATGALIEYRLLRPKNPNAAWLEPRLDRLFEVPPAVVAWLAGEYFPEESWLKLHERAELLEDLADSPFAQSFELDWQRIVDYQPLLAFDGPDEDRRLQAARKVALVFDMPLLAVNLTEACGQEPFTPAMLRLLVRDACLHTAVTYIQGWELALDASGFASPILLEEMAKFGGLFIVGSSEPWRISVKGSRPVFQTAFAPPTSAERLALWEQALKPETSLAPETLRNLAAQFSLTGEQIENAAFTVFNKSHQTGQAFSAEDLFHAARQQSSHNLRRLAQKIEARYSWQDIVLPAEEMAVLHDLVAMVRNRGQVLEEWGLGKKLTSSAGISALFTGEPGTGKTLAAQVIAAELHLDLYRIDLSTVVSKYIGETEKNLEKIFNEAQSSDAILFFDEADAIFGKRSEVKDAHDRYANIEVGYLLQRMEGYDGVTILATNLRSNIDDAFTRRLQFIVNFPFPDELQRQAIWKVLLPPTLPCQPDIDWEFLATKYALAGGNIRNILVTAAFLSAQDRQVMGMTHLLTATRREMQKMGRLIKESDYTQKK